MSEQEETYVNLVNHVDFGAIII